MFRKKYNVSEASICGHQTTKGGVKTYANRLEMVPITKNYFPWDVQYTCGTFREQWKNTGLRMTSRIENNTDIKRKERKKKKKRRQAEKKKNWPRNVNMAEKIICQERVSADSVSCE